ncbi:MAG: hypothetical protein CBD58_01660 [bacterium TMED198]|nr:MAG: hypothetical protein CBD58_01660 [bacterium TMED198]
MFLLKNERNLSKILFGVVVILIGYGILMMYSASALLAKSQFNNNTHFLIKQLYWLIIGFLAFFLSFSISYENIKRFIYLLLCTSIVGLIVPYFIENGGTTNRWLIINGRNWLTTSDFGKLALICFVSYYADKYSNRLDDFKFLMLTLTPVLGLVLGLIIFQPDYSTFMIISLIVFTQLCIAGLGYKYMMSIVASGIIGSFIMILSYPHVKRRAFQFFSGMDVQQFPSVIAMGHGGWKGVGLGSSIMKNGHISAVHTDFIIPIIGEELGFFMGPFLVFSLFLILFIVGLNIAKNSKDKFGFFLAVGITINFITYFLINSAYSINLLPTTGLPMPFISYGGSHTIFNLINIGILMNIHKKSISKNFHQNIIYE